MNKKTNNILKYRVSGKGHPVVFLHGFLESSTMWDFLDLPKSIQQIVIDLPGHGGSFKATEDLTMAGMAKHVLAVVAFLGIGTYSVVGHSMGGYVGLELMKLDSNCKKLVLLNSNFWKDSPEKVVNRRRVAKVVRTNKTHFLYEAIPNLFLNPQKHDSEVKNLIEEARLMKSTDIGNVSIAMGKRNDNKNVLKKNLDRVLLIQGEEDSTVLKLEMDKHLIGLNPNYHVLKNTGHMAHIESAEKTRNVILTFIG